MALTTPEVTFGIGTVVLGDQPETAVVIDDQMLTLREIVRRYSTPHAVAPPVRIVLDDWDRWYDWLRGLDLRPSVDDGWKHMDTVKFTMPIPDPVNIFHTFHNYVRPSSTTGKVDPPKAERVLPDLFLGSRSALSGHGDTVEREHGGIEFDFELEVTAVIGKTAFRVPAERADEYVAGYTIANDLTMHFGWWRTIRQNTRLNDNIRMKNFPGYTPMGRVIVPRDVVGDANDLALKVRVDGELRVDSSTSGMIWKVNELVEYLSWIMPLHPGDVILAGSPEELPLPPGEKRGLKTGQTVECEVERLGRLATHIAEQSALQPNERPVVDTRT